MKAGQRTPWSAVTGRMGPQFLTGAATVCRLSPGLHLRGRGLQHPSSWAPCVWKLQPLSGWDRTFAGCVQVGVFAAGAFTSVRKGTTSTCPPWCSPFSHQPQRLVLPSESCRLGRHDKPGYPRGAGRAGAERREGEPLTPFACFLSQALSLRQPFQPWPAEGGDGLRGLGLEAAGVPF